MNPKVEAAIERIRDWWSDLNDNVRGLIVGLVCGFILGSVVF